MKIRRRAARLAPTRARRPTVTRDAGETERADHERADHAGDVESLTALLLSGRHSTATRSIEASAARIGESMTVVELLGPAMRRVGESWERGEVNIADEHLATVIATDCLAILRQRVLHAADAVRPRVLCVAPDTERHLLPVTMVACVLEDAGCEVCNVGCDLPEGDVFDLATRWNAEVACISVSLASSLPAAVRLANGLADLGVRVAIGGAAAHALRGQLTGRWEVPDKPIEQWARSLVREATTEFDASGNVMSPHA